MPVTTVSPVTSTQPGVVGRKVAHEIYNPTKYVILTVTNKTCSIYSQYSLYGQTLQHASEAKYLGLTLDANLNFNKHIDNIIKYGST